MTPFYLSLFIPYVAVQSPICSAIFFRIPFLNPFLLFFSSFSFLLPFLCVLLLIDFYEPPLRLSAYNPLYITSFHGNILRFLFSLCPSPLSSFPFFAFFFLWELMMPNRCCLLFISPNYPYLLNFCFLITMSTGKEPFANWYWEEARMNKNKEKSYLVYSPCAYRYHLWSLLRTRLMTDPDFT